MVGDHHLGGIGTTISAWESLTIRGYDVQSVALFSEDRYDNHTYLKEYFEKRSIHAFSIPPPPERLSDANSDARAMREYYAQTSSLRQVNEFANRFIDAHASRIADLKAMPAEADQVIWHPFMQHSERSKDTIVAMDSAYGDYFDTYSTKQAKSSQTSLLRPAFDGSASWWTQGLGHGNPQLALTAAHAAGRYGHVMFGGAVHKPALTLAQTLIAKMGNPRLSKVFYSDNGSTGMEVAVKMALRAATVQNGWRLEDEVLILGLKNSYHGDTIGTMDCSEPSIYNKKVAWYSGRGHWLDFPQVKMRNGQWIVELPEEWDAPQEMRGSDVAFGSLGEVFNFEKRMQARKFYMKLCDEIITELKRSGKKLGALILEPVILGAGGMMFADPLFQRCLVEAVRSGKHTSQQAQFQNEQDWTGMPVIFDEVFTGLYRLGRFSAATFLGIDPDIVVNAKLLTGGLLPLCTTTASQAIFDAFLSDDKSDALLHGHSYTAHAVGCTVANQSLKVMEEMDRNETWEEFKKSWIDNSETTSSSPGTQPWSMWSPAFLKAISYRPSVDYVFALGSVLAISLRDPNGAGYASTAAAFVRDKLFAGSPSEDAVIHSRVLGNVLYLMAAMTTKKQILDEVEEKVFKALE